MANPFYGNDKEENRAYKKMLISCVAAASMVVLLFLVVLFLNSKDNKKVQEVPENSAAETQNELNEYIGSSNLTSEDLDFWEMFEKDDDTEFIEEEGEMTPYKTGDKKSTDSKAQDDKNGKNSESLNKTPDKDAGLTDSKYDDGKHIAIEDKDGNKIWYEILSDVKKNTYDFNNKLINENNKLSYSDDSKKSQSGIDLSQHNGSVDFAKVKAAGIDFAMLRIGIRGYGSGIISLDEKFVEYATAAKANGIDIGVHFFSQAISKDEAVEEACYAVGAANNFGIRYPIAIDLKETEDDTARTDKLSVNERTEFVKAFCDTVRQYGYNPIIYADRSMLIKNLDLKELENYDIWLSDMNIPTDYPYSFTMWQYNDSGTVDGIEGTVNFDISFIDYSEK